MAFGVDYSVRFPGASALRSAGVKFVARYLSPLGNSKNLTQSEVNACLANDIAIVVVWETTATRALGGFSAGQSDASRADAEVKSFGMPGIPIYFAVDWDVTPTQQAAINSYLDGVASVIGRARTGIYGGYWPVSRALDAGKAKWAWQTYAWSGGQWDHRADVQQYSNGLHLAGIEVDFDRSVTNDFGQWPRPGNGGGPVSHPTLRLGDTGDEVKAMQRRINVWDAAHPALSIDGDFGPSTLAGLREFQKEHGLTVDGVCGPNTWTALLKNPNPPTPPAGQLPAPADFKYAGRRVSIGVKWDAVPDPNKMLTGYTVQCWQMNGVKVDEQVVTGTSARFDLLVVGWQYRFKVWANGGKVAPPDSEFVLTV